VRFFDLVCRSLDIAGSLRVRGLLVAANIGRPVRAVMQREFADDDRITERTFCAALAEQLALALPVQEWVKFGEWVSLWSRRSGCAVAEPVDEPVQLTPVWHRA
jgi:hypothetical protein